MTTKTRTRIIAEYIAQDWLAQGLSIEDLRRHDLTTGDCAYIREKYPTDDYPAEAMSADEWRVVTLDVERAIREYA